ncbi:flavin reductase family protein [Candidatus Micrarchaeota archaeon]|nr:flavin reductase family protein [Candidatus Micrarchaeota archaeon]
MAQITRDPRDFWKVLAPRLTVLVTTMDRQGRTDVSAFSFVSPISFDPPLIGIASGVKKHSYDNLLQKREFVVNLPTEKMIEKIAVAGQKWDPHVSKIERAGLKTKPAVHVGPPLLAECPVSAECYLEEAKKYGDHVLLIGKVIALHVRDELVDEKGRLKVALVRPALHVADNLFAFPYVSKEAKG